AACVLVLSSTYAAAMQDLSTVVDQNGQPVPQTLSDTRSGVVADMTGSEDIKSYSSTTGVLPIDVGLAVAGALNLLPSQAPTNQPISTGQATITIPAVPLTPTTSPCGGSGGIVPM